MVSHAAAMGQSEQKEEKVDKLEQSEVTISLIARYIASRKILPIKMVQEIFKNYWAAFSENQLLHDPITINEKGDRSFFGDEFNKTLETNDFAYCTRLFLSSEASDKCELIDTGDIHGSMHIGKAFETWRALGFLSDNFEINGNRAFIFNGDYVDRGPNSIEAVCLVLLLKAKNWDRVVLIQGNHERHCTKMAEHYGFSEELKRKYQEQGKRLLQNPGTGSIALADIFKTFPLMALVGQGSKDDAEHASWQLFCHGFVVPGTVGLVKRMIDDYGCAVGYYQVQSCANVGEIIDFTDLTQQWKLTTKAVADINEANWCSGEFLLPSITDDFYATQSGMGLADQAFVAKLYELNPTLVYIWRGHQHCKMCAAFLSPDIYKTIIGDEYSELLQKLEDISYKIGGRFSFGVDGPFDLSGLIGIIEDFRKLEKASTQIQQATVEANVVAVTTKEDSREVVTTYDLSLYPELSRVITLSAATDLRPNCALIPRFSYVKIVLEDEKTVSESRPTRCVCELHEIRGTECNTERNEEERCLRWKMSAPPAVEERKESIEHEKLAEREEIELKKALELSLQDQGGQVAGSTEASTTTVVAQPQKLSEQEAREAAQKSYQALLDLPLFRIFSQASFSAQAPTTLLSQSSSTVATVASIPAPTSSSASLSASPASRPTDTALEAKEAVVSQSSVIGKKESEWQCPVCTLRNEATRTSCGLCGNEKPNLSLPSSTMAAMVASIPAPTSSSTLSSASPASRPTDTALEAKEAVVSQSSVIGKKESTWRCSACTLDNEATRTRCEACGKENPNSLGCESSWMDKADDKGWMCSCGLMNESMTTSCANEACNMWKCGGCEHINEPVKDPAKSPEAKSCAKCGCWWICGSCEWVNGPKAESCCESCQCWICDGCGFMREPRDERCETCKIRKVAAKPWHCPNCRRSNRAASRLCGDCKQAKPACRYKQ
jgi:hypothetical protein